jgi:hypothetical protein
MPERVGRMVALGALNLTLMAVPVFAQSQERVHFATGNDNASLEATVTGDEHRDYLLGARAGQTMGVSIIQQGDGQAYFNILPPGSTGEAIYIGSTDGDDGSVELPVDGDYTIRVCLMGGDRDSGRKVPFMLSMAIM